MHVSTWNEYSQWLLHGLYVVWLTSTGVVILIEYNSQRAAMELSPVMKIVKGARAAIQSRASVRQVIFRMSSKSNVGPLLLILYPKLDRLSIVWRKLRTLCSSFSASCLRILSIKHLSTEWWITSSPAISPYVAIDQDRAILNSAFFLDQSPNVL